MMNRVVLSLILPALIVVSCTSTVTYRRTPEPEAQATVSQRPAVPETHANLHPVLFVQTAAEFRAVAMQTYRVATAKIDDALVDSSWNALPQYEAKPEMPVAVILDVDETVLDNSAYEARLIRDGGSFESKSWTDWVNEANAGSVPGALEFCRAAAEKGVAVFYVTNRRAHEEEGTRRNLEKLGFPIRSDVDAVLTRGEREEWASSDKIPRRAFVARDYRVLFLFGDDLRDFVDGASADVVTRAHLVDENVAMWGSKWFVIPNGTYGSWIDAILGNERGLDESEILSRKHRALDTKD